MRELLPRGDHLGLQLLNPPGRSYHPAVVPEVLLDLPPDRGDRVGEEVLLQGRVELVGRPNQGNVGHLVEILRGDALAAVTAGHRPRAAPVLQKSLVWGAGRPNPGGAPGRPAREG